MCRSMANVNPGQEHDATNSWNGYNHQGKVALYVALQTINQLIACGKQADIDLYFLEIEWVEDFSIGYHTNGTDTYQSIHQVKAWKKDNLKDYSSALFSLTSHIRKRPSIERAYLHVQNPICFSAATWKDSLEALIEDGTYLKIELCHIVECISNASLKQQIIEKSTKQGRPENFISALKKLSSTGKLTNSTIDQALANYKADLIIRLEDLKKIGPADLDKISLYSYCTAPLKDYCELNNIKDLLEEQITHYLQITDPNGWKHITSTFIYNMYLYLMGQLDQYLVQRHQDYSGSPDRKIQFSTIVKWASSDEPATNSETFYLYHLKDSLFELSAKQCSRCMDNPSKCDFCQVPVCMDTLGHLSFNEFNHFIRATNPQFGGKMDMNSYSSFFQYNGFYNPFFNGLKQFEPPYLKAKIPISFSAPEKALWLLTTLNEDGADNAKEYYCANIIKNYETRAILMDYDVLISKDITSDSIFSDAGDYLQDFSYEQDDHHIAHYKNVKIKPLEECIGNLNKQQINLEKVK